MKNLLLSLCISFTSSFYTLSSYAAVSYEEFLELKRVTHLVFEELRPSEKHILFVNKQPSETMERFWWDLDTVNASFFKMEMGDEFWHHITVFGGFAKQPFMTADALAVTICHEIAHGLGGEPFKESGSTAEGQADYFATKTCLPLFFKYYTAQTNIVGDIEYIEDLCSREDQRDDRDYCVRSMNALKGDIEFFRMTGEESFYDQASPFIEDEFNHGSTYYPTAQCRIDIMIHGILNLERPRCFDPNGIERVL